MRCFTPRSAGNDNLIWAWYAVSAYSRLGKSAARGVVTSWQGVVRECSAL